MNINTNYIVDSSFVLAFLFNEDEHVGIFFDQYSKGHISLYAPTLLMYEVGNVVRSRYLRKKITEKQANDLLQEFLSCRISTFDTDPAAILAIAIKKNLSFYDASYVELSEEYSMPLLTFDEFLQKSAN